MEKRLQFRFSLMMLTEYFTAQAPFDVRAALRVLVLEDFKGDQILDLALAQTLVLILFNDGNAVLISIKPFLF